MADAVDEDVKAGAKATWSGFVETVALVPAASVYSGSLPAEPAPPYMQLDSAPDGERTIMTGPDYLDPRKLTLRVLGLEATVKLATALAQAAFCPPPNYFAIANSVVMHCLPGDERLTEEPTKYHGETLWKLELDFHLLLVRALDQTGLTLRV